MAYHCSKTLESAFDVLDQPGVSVIAGGTDWFAAQGDRIATGPMLDVNRLPGFRGISRTDAGWRIGAATRWADIARADLPPMFDALKMAAREVGSVQVQNRGTLAGNLCNASPAADGVPPLLVLGASVELLSRRGVRLVPLGAFVTGVRQTVLQPGELVSAVLVPDCAGAQSVFLKAGARRYMVISIAMLAVLARCEGGRVAEIRVAVGACGPVARRLSGLEQSLTGQTCGAPLPMIGAGHLAELAPIDDIRGSAEYRLDLVAELIRRAVPAVLKAAA